MTVDKYYSEACEDGREMAMHGIHWTQETVEKRADNLRKLDEMNEKLN